MRTYLVYILRLIVDEFDVSALRSTLRLIDSGEELRFSSEHALLELLHHQTQTSITPKTGDEINQSSRREV